MINRRTLRESVLKAVYAILLSNDDAAHVIATQIKPEAKEKEDLQFAEKLFLATVQNGASYDTYIESRIQNWELSRIALVDKIVLRMAICELLTFDDIPTKVTINEAIELAKKYSTANSGKFVNGVLDGVLEDLRKEGLINKTGIGLVESAPRRPKK
jgi:transcription antitermination protein NusB